MALPGPEPYITHEEYLEGEKISPVRHEYIAGRVYAMESTVHAMSGASRAHAKLCYNLTVLLGPQARRRCCELFQAGMKVQVEASEAYYYPDIVVTCAEEDTRSDYFLTQPRLIVEVLSPTTERFDRGEKFADYRTLPSLEEYVLVSQDKVQVEVYRRMESDRWELSTWGAGQTLHLTSLELDVAVDTIYEEVRLMPVQQPGDPFLGR